MPETNVMNAAPALPEIAEDLRLDAENPWPGLTAFTEQQQEYFYGRGEEALELFECIKRERLTVLFGKSGLGKTSLLQAGIFPQLRNSAFLPVYVRVSYATGAHPLEFQLRAALENAIQTANLAEVALPQAADTIWEYLHRRSANLIDFEGNTVKPVLIFDQFEEWFTLGSRKEFLDELNDTFLPGLTDLVENRTPRALAEKLARDRDLARRYDLDAPGCRILITLREDYLANLENLRHHMPSLVFIDNRMRLKEMNGRQAFSVVAEPNPDLVAPDVAEFITRFVAGTHTDGLAESERGPAGQPLEHLEVAPAILSLFCRQLNEERRRRRLPRITRELVAAQGVTIIDDFYLHCIANMHPAVRRMIEDQLLTKAGYRDNIDLSQARWDLERAGAGSNCIDDLVRLRLLQVEEHRGIPRLELTHDVLAEPVKRSRTLWEEEQARQEEERVRARRQQQEREALAQARQAEQEARKQANALRKVIAAIAGVALLLAGNLGFAVYERVRLNKEVDKEKRLVRIADANAKVAKAAEAAAKQSLEVAEQKTDEAEQAKSIAEREKANATLQEVNALRDRAKAQRAQDQVKAIRVSIRDCRRHSNSIVPSAKGNDSVAKDDSSKKDEMPVGDVDQCMSTVELTMVNSEDFDEIEDLTEGTLADAEVARKRGDVEAVRRLCNMAVKQAGMLESKLDDPGVGILVARAYTGVALELALIGDSAAKEKAERGSTLVAALRSRSQNSFDARKWDVLSDIYLFEAAFLYISKDKQQSIDAYVESFNAKVKASNLAPGEKHYQSEVIARGIDVGDQEREIQDNNRALFWYDKALGLARQAKDRGTIAAIYRDKRMAYVSQANYEDARKMMQERIHSLTLEPEDLQRERDLAMAYADAAEVEEGQKSWLAAVGYRAHGVTVLEALKPNAFDDRSKDLDTAYLDLAWSEIYAGQMEQGLADSKKGVALAEELKNPGKLTYVYENTVKALLANKHYEEAHIQADRYIETLLKQPEDLQRSRSLSVAYGKAAEAEEDLKSWPAAVGYRAQEVAALEGMKPDAYDERSKDLATAYLDLAWSEIYAGQLEKGLADSGKGLAVAEEIKDRGKIDYVYQNTIRALLANKHHKEAHTLADQYIEALLKEPYDLQRAQSLNIAFAKAAEAEEDLQIWPAAIDYRSNAVTVLKDLKPDAYDGRNKDLASALGGLSWAEIQAGRFEDGLRDAKAARAEDPTQTWIQVNEAHGLLLTGKTSEARELYLYIKSLPADGNRNLVSDIRDDFEQICKLGYARPEMIGIARDLGINSPELKKCFETGLHAK